MLIYSTTKKINVGGAWGHVTVCACPAHVKQLQKSNWMDGKKLNMLKLQDPMCHNLSKATLAVSFVIP